jgi:hypothetical protein
MSPSNPLNGDSSRYVLTLLDDTCREEHAVRDLLRHAPGNLRGGVLDRLRYETATLTALLATVDLAIHGGQLAFDAKTEAWANRQVLLEQKLAWALDEYRESV